MRSAWYLGGGLRAGELEALTVSDRRMYLDALDWWIEQVNAQGAAAGQPPRHNRQDGLE